MSRVYKWVAESLCTGACGAFGTWFVVRWLALPTSAAPESGLLGR